MEHPQHDFYQFLSGPDGEIAVSVTVVIVVVVYACLCVCFVCVCVCFCVVFPSAPSQLSVSSLAGISVLSLHTHCLKIESRLNSKCSL